MKKHYLFIIIPVIAFVVVALLIVINHWEYIKTTLR